MDEIISPEYSSTLPCISNQVRYPTTRVLEYIRIRVQLRESWLWSTGWVAKLIIDTAALSISVSIMPIAPGHSRTDAYSITRVSVSISIQSLDRPLQCSPHQAAPLLLRSNRNDTLRPRRAACAMRWRCPHCSADAKPAKALHLRARHARLAHGQSLECLHSAAGDRGGAPIASEPRPSVRDASAAAHRNCGAHRLELR